MIDLQGVLVYVLICEYKSSTDVYTLCLNEAYYLYIYRHVYVYGSFFESMKPVSVSCMYHCSFMQCLGAGFMARFHAPVSYLGL